MMATDDHEGWILSLKDSADSEFGEVESFYRNFRPRGRSKEFDLPWYGGRILSRGILPKEGDRIAFYHSRGARFPDHDRFQRRPRISLVGTILDFNAAGKVIDGLRVRIDREVWQQLKEQPLIRGEATEHLFRDARIVKGSAATVYHVPRRTWEEFERLRVA
jgi:hypothetical protein